MGKTRDPFIPSPRNLTPALGSLGPVARLQDLALPVSNVTITTEHSLLHKRGSEPKSLMDLTLPTSKQHQPQGLLGFCSQLPHDQAPLTSSQDCTRQSLATNQAVGQPSLPDHTNKHVITTEGPMQPSQRDPLERRVLATRRECVAGTHRTTPEGHFSKIKKCNQPTTYIKIQMAAYTKVRKGRTKIKPQKN